MCERECVRSRILAIIVFYLISIRYWIEIRQLSACLEYALFPIFPLEISFNSMDYNLVYQLTSIYKYSRIRLWFLLIWSIHFWFVSLYFVFFFFIDDFGRCLLLYSFYFVFAWFVCTSTSVWFIRSCTHKLTLQQKHKYLLNKNYFDNKWCD